ncbi:MAG TPA: phosphoribosylglycinamide formyltransferase, partial [Chitinophagaceae bacterium]|nr:phosphoribosylglycinamide formyltransferase [Chitinophagaceae bacterium]
MLKTLQRKWKVSSKQLLLILCVFAITGSLTAYISKTITNWVGFTKHTFWFWKFLVRFGVLFFGYQAILLATAAIFGQFSFFWAFEKKMLQRLGFMKKEKRSLMNEKKREQRSPTDKKVFQIAIFASGAGSNAQQIINHFKKSTEVDIALIVCNKPQAGVLLIAAAEKKETLLIDRERFFKDDAYLPEFQKRKIDLIVLAGFLWKIPQLLIEAYPKRIINIHPALLPSYGGKGMYGQHVHEAVLKGGEKKSGITIHYVDEHYDNGDIIFQKECL